jgi:hypothetical protein
MYMSKNQYPTLLNEKVTMLGNLTRIDLLIVGMCYLILSFMKVSGLYSLAIIAILLFLLKFLKKRLSKGFIGHIGDDQKLSWSFKLGGQIE